MEYVHRRDHGMSGRAAVVPSGSAAGGLRLGPVL